VVYFTERDNIASHRHAEGARFPTLPGSSSSSDDNSRGTSEDRQKIAARPDPHPLHSAASGRRKVWGAPAWRGVLATKAQIWSRRKWTGRSPSTTKGCCCRCWRWCARPPRDWWVGQRVMLNGRLSTPALSSQAGALGAVGWPPSFAHRLLEKARDFSDPMSGVFMLSPASGSRKSPPGSPPQGASRFLLDIAAPRGPANSLRIHRAPVHVRQAAYGARAKLDLPASRSNILGMLLAKADRRTASRCVITLFCLGGAIRHRGCIFVHPLSVGYDCSGSRGGLVVWDRTIWP